MFLCYFACITVQRFQQPTSNVSQGNFSVRDQSQANACGHPPFQSPGHTFNNKVQPRATPPMPPLKASTPNTKSPTGSLPLSSGRKGKSMCVVRNSPTKVLADGLPDQSALRSVMDEPNVSSYETASTKDGGFQLHSRSEHGELLVNFVQTVTPSPAIQLDVDADEKTPPPIGISGSRVGNCSKSGKDDHSPSPRKNSTKMQQCLRAGIATRESRKASRNTWGSSNGNGVRHAKAGEKSRLADKRDPHWQKRQMGSTASPKSTLLARMPRFFWFGKMHANFNF
jgi:hypothetical protein